MLITRIVLAVNPTAGQGRAQGLAVLVAGRLRAAGVQVDELVGKDAEDLRGQVRHALDQSLDAYDQPVDGLDQPLDVLGQPVDAFDHRVDALVVVGGDGMVHLGVNQVAGTAVPLGIVAAGTGNDVARALGLPIRDAVAGADVVLRGLGLPTEPVDPTHLTEPTDPTDLTEPVALSEPVARSEPVAPGSMFAPGTLNAHRRTIDAVRCVPTPSSDDLVSGDDSPGPAGAPAPDHREVWFAGVLGAGFDALVNERANGWTWPRGRLKYVLAMLRELPVFRPRTYLIDLDGQRLRTAAMLVAVANGPSYGGGMRVAPDARLDDGLLDVMVVAPLSRIRFLSIFPRVYAGTHVRDPQVSIRRGRRVGLHAPGIVAYADGERIGALPLTCEVVPAAVIVLAPRAAETADG